MSKRRNHKEIIFINSNPLIGSEYAPKPATHFLPDWYKKIESHFPSDKPKDFRSLETIKKCMPVFDSMTSGYIIQTICDIAVEEIDGQPTFISSMLLGLQTNEVVVGEHPRKQAYTHPSANEFNFPKFINQWSIKTPEGYSCLFIPPMHNPNSFFTALPGIVDTDTYNGAVNFPFVLNTPIKYGVIPAGTPIVQVIPFKRDSWKSVFTEDKDFVEKWFRNVKSTFFSGYRNKYWSRKSFQ